MGISYSLPDGDGEATDASKSMSVYDQIRCILLSIRCREVALLLVSASVLSYQVILVRAFSLGQWHHFAYMVISIALLGFGASGNDVGHLLERHLHRLRAGGTDVLPGQPVRQGSDLHQ